MKKQKPPAFTDAIAAKICAERASGKSLYKICDANDTPDLATVRGWLSDKRYKRFHAQYSAAKEALAEHYADEIIEIADTEEPAKARLRIDARKWAAARLAPHLFGDKVQHIGEGGGPIETKDLSAGDTARRIAFLLEDARREKSSSDRD